MGKSSVPGPPKHWSQPMQGACEIPPQLKEYVPEYLATTVCRDPVWDDAEFMNPIKEYYSTLPTSNVERAIADADEKRGAARDFAAAGNYSKANGMFHGAVTLLGKELGKTHLLTGTALCDLAWCLIEQGRFHEADEIAIRAFKIYDEHYEEGHPATLMAASRVIKTTRMLNNGPECEQLCYRAEMAMQAAEATAVHESEQAEAAAESVRITEQKLKQAEALDDEKLIAMQSQQLIVKRAVEERTSADAAEGKKEREQAFMSLLDDLADAYRSNNKFADALRIGEKDLLLCRSIYGEQGPQTAQSLRGLAETHKARGSLPQAKLCLEESIATFEACGALEHSDYGTALGSLAHVVDLQGNSKKADRLYTKALAILMGAAATEPEDNKDQEGEEKGPSEGANPELAQILNNHAETLLLLGRKKDAKDAFRLAMKYATWS